MKGPEGSSSPGMCPLLPDSVSRIPVLVYILITTTLALLGQVERRKVPESSKQNQAVQTKSKEP